MQIYVAIEGEKAGPFTLFQIEERLRAGDLKDDHLGWHEGLQKWTPLRELAPFEGFFWRQDAELKDERLQAEAVRAVDEKRPKIEALPKSAVRPWTRFWARYLDFFFFLTACLLIYLGLRSAGWVRASYGHFVQVFPIFLPFWHLLEGYLIAQWGTTPGKALLGIHIANAEGNRLRFGASLKRSIGVYVLGIGCHIAFISLAAMGFGYYLLLKNKRSYWDVIAESHVRHDPFHPRQVVLPLAIVFLILTVLHGPLGEIADYHTEMMEKLRDQFSGKAPSEAP